MQVQPLRHGLRRATSPYTGEALRADEGIGPYIFRVGNLGHIQLLFLYSNTGFTDQGLIKKPICPPETRMTVGGIDRIRRYSEVQIGLLIGC